MDKSVLYRNFTIKQHDDGKWYVYKDGKPYEAFKGFPDFQEHGPHEEFEMAKGMIDHYFYLKRIRDIKN